MASMGYPDVQLQSLLLGFISLQSIKLKTFWISLPLLQQPLVYSFLSGILHPKGRYLMGSLCKMLLHVAQCHFLCFLGSIPLTAFQGKGCRPRSCVTAPHSQITTPCLQSWLSWQQQSAPSWSPGKFSIPFSILPPPLPGTAVCSKAGYSCLSWLSKKWRKQKG